MLADAVKRRGMRLQVQIVRLSGVASSAFLPLVPHDESFRCHPVDNDAAGAVDVPGARRGRATCFFLGKSQA